MNDFLIQYGGEVKALGDGKISVKGIVFSDAKNPDLERDYFQADTDFGVEFPVKITAYYNHGQDSKVGLKKLGGGPMKFEAMKADDGVWFQGQLDLADEYEAMIYRLAEKGVLGASSGSAPHLVRRESIGGAFKITHWQLAEISLTPTPAEPNTLVCTTWTEFLAAQKTEPTKSMKAELLGDYVEQDMTWAAINVADDALFYNVIWGALNDDALTNDAKLAKINAALIEFGGLIAEAVTGLLADEATELAEGSKSLRELWQNPKEFTTKERRTATKQAIANLTEIVTRWNALIEQAKSTGQKSGAMLSKENAQSVLSIYQALTESLASMVSMMDKAGISYTNESVSGPNEVDDSQKSFNLATLEYELQRFEAMKEELTF